jgi:hypothetical protein
VGKNVRIDLESFSQWAPINPPTIGSFTATHGSINVGGSSTLAWSGITNATSCSIDNGVGSVPCNGNTSVSPAANTTYTLTATGPGGTTTATASVTFNAPVITSFSRSGGCTNPPTTNIDRVDFFAAEFHEGELECSGGHRSVNIGCVHALGELCARLFPPERMRIVCCPKRD